LIAILVSDRRAQDVEWLQRIWVCNRRWVFFRILLIVEGGFHCSLHTGVVVVFSMERRADSLHTGVVVDAPEAAIITGLRELMMSHHLTLLVNAAQW
jgi:hypothetical protein